MSKIKILVCCHKHCEIPEDPIYLPIQVGKALHDYDLGIQTDNQADGKACDNISDLNNVFSEMTAVYWAWKNMEKISPETEYIGLCHYRRFFYCKGSLKDSFLRRKTARALCTAKFFKRHWTYSMYQEVILFHPLGMKNCLSATQN